MKERLREKRSLKERFKSWGIKKVLFDVDSTLMDTTKLYRGEIRKYCDILARESEKDKGELIGMFLQGVKALREEFGVHPAVIEVTARVLARMAAVDGEVLEKEVEKLMRIYVERPAVFEGAVEEVEKVRGAGVDTAAVTHSGKEWTFIKLEPFRGKFEKSISTPVDRPKDKEQWQKAMEELDCRPEEVMIVGDSMISDMIPGLRLGVKKLVWVRGGKSWEEQWKKLAEGEKAKYARYEKKPGQVIVIERINQLTEKLLEV